MKLVGIEKCCGCEACYNVCPKFAICMVKDQVGFFYPSIDHTKCIECGLCSRVCPAIHSLQNKSKDINAYTGGYQNKDKLRKVASGGIATAIMEFFINKGMYICGAGYEDSLYECHHILGNQQKLIHQIQGTKYIQSRIGMVYRKIEKLLIDKKQVFFVGTPCQVVALKKYLHKEYENLFTCDLICHGPTSQTVQEQYVKYFENLLGKKCIKINPKDKIYGWETPTLTLMFEGGNSVEAPFYHTAFGDAFENMTRISCLNCLYKGERRCSDVTIGDFWGVKKTDECFNPNGVSVAITHSEKGEKLMALLTSIEIKTKTIEQALKNNSMYKESCKVRPYKKKFRSLFGVLGLFTTSIRTTPLWRRFYLCLKNIIHKRRIK